MEPMTSPISSKSWQKVPAYWEKPSMKFNSHGLEELKQANYALWSLPKWLRFLRVVPTTESPKVMGLKGIHYADALRHYAGCTYCPWCGKEGQNKGTIVNHLRTTHYRLGLVCDRCFGCPTVMSDTLCWHGHANSQWYCEVEWSNNSVKNMFNFQQLEIR